MRALNRRPNKVIRLVTRDRGSLWVQPSDSAVNVDSQQETNTEAEIATSIVTRIQQGQMDAETELVERYQDRLRYVLLRKIPRFSSDIDDVIQTTMAAVIVRLRTEGIDHPERLGGFIYGVARNTYLGLLRERARLEEDPDDVMKDNREDDGPDPMQLTASQELTQIVRRLLSELGEAQGSSRDREVLTRLFIHQQDRDEICEALGIPKDHLRRVVHRAKQRLKTLILEADKNKRLHLIDGD